jgi:hypothetical protein
MKNYSCIEDNVCVVWSITQNLYNEPEIKVLVDNFIDKTTKYCFWNLDSLVDEIKDKATEILDMREQKTFINRYKYQLSKKVCG